MLSHLLPGLRELRAPLAAGYLWFLGFWILLGDRIPDRGEATGALKRMYELADVVSLVGTGVALSFVAYLLGVFSQGLSRKPLLIAARTLRRQAIIHVTESETFEREVDPSEIPAESPDQGDLAQTDAKEDDGQKASSNCMSFSASKPQSVRPLSSLITRLLSEGVVWIPA